MLSGDARNDIEEIAVKPVMTSDNVRQTKVITGKADRNGDDT